MHCSMCEPHGKKILKTCAELFAQIWVGWQTMAHRCKEDQTAVSDSLCFYKGLRTLRTHTRHTHLAS